MAANVAVKLEPESDPETNKPIISNVRPKTKPERSAARSHHSTARIGELSTTGDANGSDESATELLADVESTESSMSRLTAALTDDAIEAQTLPQQSLTTLEARIRVDLLISRAKQLLDVRQFDQALRSALLAQDLSECAQLDFSPDEDRPIDLVRRIEGQLEATLADQPARDDDLVESAPAKVEPEPIENSSKSTASSSPQENEKSKRARSRRDWSTLFRRDKKSTTTELESTSHDTKPAKAEPGTNPHKNDEQARIKPSPPARDGIVVANRSVAIGNVESSEATAISFALEPADETPAERPFSKSSRSENFYRADSERIEDHDHNDSSTGINSELNNSKLVLDDGGVQQSEIEVGEPTLPSTEEIELGNETPTRRTFSDVETDDGRSDDWNILYILFGISSLFAVTCYRRGAT
jgi:hypothetical protein